MDQATVVVTSCLAKRGVIGFFFDLGGVELLFFLLRLFLLSLALLSCIDLLFASAVLCQVPNFFTVVTLPYFFLEGFALFSSVNLYWHHAVLVFLGIFSVLVSFAKKICSFLFQFLLELAVVNLDCHDDHLL